MNNEYYVLRNKETGRVFRPENYCDLAIELGTTITQPMMVGIGVGGTSLIVVSLFHRGVQQEFDIPSDKYSVEIHNKITRNIKLVQ